MQAVILAGGLGTRLRPLTESVPKPMVRAAGRPFLEYIVRHLAEQGFMRQLLLTGYLGEQIRSYFGDGSGFGAGIEYASEPKPMGTAGAIRSCLDRVDAVFLLVYGDSLLPIRYQPAVEEFERSRCQGLLLVYDNRHADTGVRSNVAVSEDGLVLKYDKRPGAAGVEYVEAGVVCLRRDALANLPEGQPASLEQDVYPQLAAAGRLRAFVTPQRFFDIGTPERLREFSALYA